MRAKTFKITLNICFKNVTEQYKLEQLLDWFKYEYNENHYDSIKNPFEDLCLIAIENLD